MFRRVVDRVTLVLEWVSIACFSVTVLLVVGAGMKEGFLWVLDLLCLPFCIGLLYGIYRMMEASLYMTSSVLEISMIFYYLPLFIGFSMLAVYLSLPLFDFFLKRSEKGGDR